MRTDDSQEKDSTNSPSSVNHHPSSELDEKVRRLLNEFDGFINDDFHTAMVLANMFELVPVINSIKDKRLPADALPRETLVLLQTRMKTYVEDIMGLKTEEEMGSDKLKGVIDVLIALRKEARAKKDWATSDKIRNQLAETGIQLKDEKDGEMSWTAAG
jgi:cysteinyl-tRNA synthetase